MLISVKLNLYWGARYISSPSAIALDYFHCTVKIYAKIVATQEVVNTSECEAFRM
jgi:hypothetical protein